MPIGGLFDFKHILTPIAIVKATRREPFVGSITFRTLRVFSLRIAYWTCDE